MQCLWTVGDASEIDRNSSIPPDLRSRGVCMDLNQESRTDQEQLMLYIAQNILTRLGNQDANRMI